MRGSYQGELGCHLSEEIENILIMGDIGTPLNGGVVSSLAVE